MKNLRLILTSVLALLLFVPVQLIAEDYPVSGLKLVTDVSEISSDKHYAIVAMGSDGNMYAMLLEASSTTGALVAEKLDRTGVMPAKGVCTITKGSGSFVIKNSSATLYRGTGGTTTSNLYVSSGKSRTENFYLASKIAGGGLIIKKDDGEHFIGIKGDYTSFKFYSANTMAPAYLYECTTSAAEPETVGTISINTAEGYGTYFIDKAFAMPEGLQGAYVNGVDASTSDLQMEWVFKAGDVVPANTALLVYGTKGSYDVKAPTIQTASAENTDERKNLLMGTLTAQETAAPAGASADDYKFYKMYYLTDADTGQKTLGFYWGEQNGGTFTNAANRAYLALPKTTSMSANRTQGFALPNDPATGILQVQKEQHSVADGSSVVYDLSGRRVGNAKLGGTQRGIYIVNGKKVMNR